MECRAYYLASVLSEPPNIISFVHQFFADYEWADQLYIWENLIFSIFIGFLVWLFFHMGLRKKALIPTGFQNFVELIGEQFLKGIYGILGPESKKYVPFLGTLFVFILAMNLSSLVPLLKAPSSSLNVTLSLSLCVFVYVLYLNIRNMGLFGYLYHLAGSPKSVVEWAIAPLMFPLELITQLSRPLTLALRLFGNVMGEEALVGYFTLLGVFAFNFFGLHLEVGIPLQLPFMFLGMLTSLMQALVFSLLSAVYIMLATPHSDQH